MTALSCELEVIRRGRNGVEPFRLEAALEAAPGMTILFGPSGSGKSTILQAIAGLLRPSAGRIALGDEVWFDGGQRRSLAVERRRVAYVFQSLALFPHLTGIGNVAYGISREHERGERRARARELLERFGVGHLADRRPRTYSGGEAQRVALARAMAISPRVMLLDEPFSALDREIRHKLWSEVRDLIDELGVPALCVTHDRDEARALGDRVVRLTRGQVTETGGVEILG